MTDEAGLRDMKSGNLKEPKRRHRQIRDELAKIGELKRDSVAAREAKPRKPGGRYHAPKGRRARLRRFTGSQLRY